MKATMRDQKTAELRHLIDELKAGTSPALISARFKQVLESTLAEDWQQQPDSSAKGNRFQLLQKN